MWQMMLVVMIVFALAIVVPKMARSQSMDDTMAEEATISSSLDEEISSDAVEDDVDLDEMDESMEGNETPLGPAGD